MRMPREAGQIVLGPIVAEVIHHQERIEIGRVAEAERAAQLDAGAFHCRNGLADAFDGTNGHVSPPDRTKIDLVSEYTATHPVLGLKEVWPVLCSKALLAEKIGIGGDHRKSINRSDWIYRSG